MTLPRGVRLGVDVGTVRIGVARSDPDGLVATPVETVPRAVASAGPAAAGAGSPGSAGPAAPSPGSTDPAATSPGPADPEAASSVPGGPEPASPGPTGPAASLTPDVARLVEIVGEESAVVVYVGLPRHLSGTEGAAAGAVRDYSVTLAQAVAPVPVRLVDERMTTVSAHRALHASGRSGRRHREVVDQVAAVMILQSALDAERATGRRGGAAIGSDEAPGAGEG